MAKLNEYSQPHDKEREAVKKINDDDITGKKFCH
jgi:hypothetical protein